LIVHNFKLIKEASDSTHVEQFSNKTIDYPAHKPAKKSKPANRKFTVNSFIDTVIKSKNRFKIVLEDSVGNKKEYNSIEELPADAQKEFLKENSKLNELQNFDFKFKFPDSNKFVYNFTNKFHSNPEWKKQAEEMRKQAEDMRKQSNSPELKKLMEDMRKQSNSPELKKLMEDMRKQSNSPELKKLMEDMRKQSNSPELKKLMEDIKVQGEEIQKQFNSPEWKKQMEDIKIQSEKTSKQFNSPEWKKQMENLRLQSAQIGKQSEAMRKYYQSPEWKKQQKKIQKEIEKSQKEWKNSKDFQPQSVIPEKPSQPEQL